MADGGHRELTRFAIPLELWAKLFPCIRVTSRSFLHSRSHAYNVYVQEKISNIRSLVRITVTGSFVVLQMWCLQIKKCQKKIFLIELP